MHRCCCARRRARTPSRALDHKYCTSGCGGARSGEIENGLHYIHCGHSATRAHKWRGNFLGRRNRVQMATASRRYGRMLHSTFRCYSHLPRVCKWHPPVIVVVVVVVDVDVGDGGGGVRSSSAQCDAESAHKFASRRTGRALVRRQTESLCLL